MLQVSEPKHLHIAPRSGLLSVEGIGSRDMRADRLISENISALLSARGLSQKDLAQWCRKSEVWISFKLAGKRDWHARELDRVADFFGVAAFQLMQPGISQITERRSPKDRRSGRDRRISHAQRVMMAMKQNLDAARPRRASGDKA